MAGMRRCRAEGSIAGPAQGRVRSPCPAVPAVSAAGVVVWFAAEEAGGRPSKAQGGGTSVSPVALGEADREMPALPKSPITSTLPVDARDLPSPDPAFKSNAGGEGDPEAGNSADETTWSPRLLDGAMDASDAGREGLDEDILLN